MATLRRALLIDDRPDALVAAAQMLHQEGWQVLFADDFSAAAEYLSHDVEIVICKAQIGRESGLSFIMRWKSLFPTMAFIVVVSSDDSIRAAHAVKAGAAAGVEEPIDLEELRIWIRRCAAQGYRRHRVQQLETRLDRRGNFDAIIGQSKVMLQRIEQARAAAAETSPLLISGEDGTGKALFAEVIHQNSPHCDRPFVCCEITGLSARQVELELFGPPAGSAPSAPHMTISRTEQAQGGTLLVTDVADLPAVSQARLARALERGLITGSSGAPDRPFDVRLIAATVRKLDALAAEGRYSMSLFRQLNPRHLRLPPLRERREDIPLLVEHLLRRLCEERARPVPRCEPELLRFLERFEWPGNVRQLRQCLASMLAAGPENILRLDHLPADLDDPAQAPAGMHFPPGMSLAELERAAVEQALAHCAGNRTRAAARLGISVRTLQRKLKLWNMDDYDVSAEQPAPQRTQRSV